MLGDVTNILISFTFRRNTHGVPKSTIQDMLDCYEKKVSLEYLIRPVKLRYVSFQRECKIENFDPRVNDYD